ncbi:hypothetical protein BgiBS90_035837 [Biomphalaria glabrata]|nr:hypothetical protein BgiBS90_035837 [Biomphalaria glabrata]
MNRTLRSLAAGQRQQITCNSCPYRISGEETFSPVLFAPHPKGDDAKAFVDLRLRGVRVTPREMDSSTKGSDRDIVIGGNSSRFVHHCSGYCHARASRGRDGGVQFHRSGQSLG